MDNFIQRMIERLHGRVMFSMSPERRTRKLAIVNSFTVKTKPDKKKENSSPLNNAKAITFKPRNEDFTDLNLTKTGDSSEGKEAKRVPDRPKTLEREESSKNARSLVRKWEVLKNGTHKNSSPNSQVRSSKEESKSYNPIATLDSTIRESDGYEENVGGESPGFRKDPIDFTHNLLNVPSVSTTNLLEEIEDGLPSSYSLVNVLDHTPHTVTNVRTFARLSRVGKNLIQTEEEIKQLHNAREDSVKKLKHLEMEAYIQKTLVDQVNKVVGLCKDNQKFLEYDYVETLRTLLAAKLRYDAINMEIQNVKLSSGELKEDNFGEVSITDIEFKLNDTKILDQGPFICVTSQREHLFASHAQNKVVDGLLHFPVNFKFSNLHQNFVIYLELYQLNSNLKGKNETSKLLEFKSFMKKARLKTSKNLCGKSEEQDFVCIGKTSFRLVDVKERQNGRVHIDFNKVFQCEFEKTVSISLVTKISLNTELNGFLNLFKNTCWHRLWCCLGDYSLQFWNYPEDKDNGKEVFESLYLPHCKEEVQPVSLDVCIRPYTFKISYKETDRSILLSASSHREMMNWINLIKSLILYLELWSPDF